MLAGTVRGSDYSGTRGRGSGGSTGPLPDDALEALAAEAEAKKRLRHDLRGVLLVFLAMQWTMDGAPSGAGGSDAGPSGRDPMAGLA